jgi:hypothetical protein
MVAAAFAWYLGDLWGPAVYIHRAPLAVLLLTYPRGRPSTPAELATTIAVVAYAILASAWANDGLTIAFAVGLATVAGVRLATAGGVAHRARLSALAATIAFAIVLITGGAVRLAGVGVERTELAAYDLVVLLIGIGLFADLHWGRWGRAAVTGVVVELGLPVETSLRDKLARVLGDPGLVFAYRLDGSAGWRDETGRPIELPADAARVTTSIDIGHGREGVLVHDPAILDEPELVSAVAAATRVAVANVHLRAGVVARVHEVEASRRRLVEAADEQRCRLEAELRAGAEQRLERVQQLVSFDPELLSQVDMARTELREFARGIHPASLTEGGLAAALYDLAARSTVSTTLSTPPDRYPPAIEAAAYFVCSEALANTAKHSQADEVRIDVSDNGVRLLVEIRDDGTGGADVTKGSGLRGLVDRAEALGGTLQLESPPDRGTRLTAELPLV